MNPNDLINFSSADELASTVAQAWLMEIARANRAGQAQHVALSGGRITLKFFAEVVALSRAQQISLSGVHFFWADERCVPADDPESNFGAAQAILFRPLGLAADKIHRILGEQSPERAAAFANEEIKRLVPVNASGLPMLDLIFLGMGEDAHVASLFPRDSLAVGGNLIAYHAVTNSPKPPAVRVTMSYAAVAAARQVWVLASGSGKEDALRDSLLSGSQTPLGRVLGMRERTKIYTDLKIG